MKTVRKLSLSNIKISLVSRHAERDCAYFLKVGVGANLQRSESLKKQTHQSFYEYRCLEIEWEPLADTLQIDFMRNGQGLPEVVGESEVLIDNLLSSSMEQLKLPLISNFHKVGWIYFEVAVKEERSVKKQQWLYLNSVVVEYAVCQVGSTEYIAFQCHGLIRETQRKQVLNNKVEFLQQLAFPVRFTQMVTLEVRSHQQHHGVMDSRYASVYFLVENIRRGESSELHLPLFFRNSNKKIGEIVINYYLENIHLPNTEMEKSVYSEKKTERATTPSTNHQSKSMEDQLLQDPLSEVENILVQLETARSRELKYAKKDNGVYKFGMGSRAPSQSSRRY